MGSRNQFIKRGRLLSPEKPRLLGGQIALFKEKRPRSEREWRRLWVYSCMYMWSGHWLLGSQSRIDLQGELPLNRP